MAHLAVQIEHRDLVRVLEIAPESQGTLDLTTMRRDQRKAVIEVFLVDGPDRRVVASFVAPSLPNLEKRKPLIQLKGAVHEGRARLQLFVEGQLVDTKGVDVRRFLPRRSFIPVLLGAVVLLLLVGGAYLLFLRDEAPEAPVPNAPQATAPEPRTTTQAPSPGSAPEATGRVPDSAAPAGPSPSTVPSTTPATAPADPAPEGTIAPRSIPREAGFTVYFTPNSAVLTPAAQEELRRVQTALERNPVDQLRIVGHTALAGTEAGRIELSWDRARAVQAFLSEGGVEDVDQAQVIGRGGEDPVVRDLERQQRNRRVEIYFDG